MRASGAERLRVEVLGPIRVLDGDGRDLTPDGALQRRLLALLVVRRGHVVSPDAAIEALWPTGRPRDPAAALQNHLYRLRRDLPAGVVESTANGYRLDPSAIELDADRLAAALSGGAAMEGAALSELETMLARWHGPAYPELADVDEGRTEASRLEELRVQAAEARAEHRLAAGDTDGLVVELTALADEHRLRERPRALLMEALAATGRTVEALRVYDDFRRLLGDEFGIEPSPTLTAQHADVLRGAPPEAWAPVTRLPVPVTSLVGRDVLVGELIAAIGEHRLVTLVGPSGVGKTRLLIELGHRLLAARARRPVVMCELAPATDETAIDAVAAALAIEGRPAGGLAARVASVLGDTELALLLDNCEHVLDAVAELVDHVLAGCPNVRVVATSQERLRVAGEQVHRVPTLPASADGGPAVELFVDRARAVAPGFEPAPGELTTIVDIVRRLDGLPLAIELATARLHTLEVAEVAAGLDDRFDLLSTGYRTASRHGSLAAAMSWSLDQLDPRLQLVFADLSVFTVAFTVADAAAVSGVDLGAARADLDQLVERSLVMRAPPRRFVLLETLRAFGAEQRAASGRADVAAERHARHQVAWTEAADRRMLEPGADAVPEIDAAIPELRSALGWLLEHQHVELAGRLVSAILDYGIMRLRPDVLAWAEQVADVDPDDTSPRAPVVWAVSAYAAWMAGDLAESIARGRRALRAFEHGGGDMPGEVAMVCANNALFEGRLDDAVAWYQRGVEATVHDRAQHLMARSTQLLGRGYRGDAGTAEAAAALLAEIGEDCTPYAAYTWYCAGEAELSVDLDRAKHRLRRALELAELTNASFVTGIAGASKTSIEARLGDPAVAAEEYRRLIAHWRRAGMWSTQWTMLRSIAGLLARLERHRDAAVLLGAVRATQAGHRIFGADDAALTELAARLRGELGDDAYQEALDEGAGLDGDDAVEHALRAL